MSKATQIGGIGSQVKYVLYVPAGREHDGDKPVKKGGIIKAMKASGITVSEYDKNGVELAGEKNLHVVQPSQIIKFVKSDSKPSDKPEEAEA